MKGGDSPGSPVNISTAPLHFTNSASKDTCQQGITRISWHCYSRRRKTKEKFNTMSPPPRTLSSVVRLIAKAVDHRSKTFQYILTLAGIRSISYEHYEPSSCKYCHYWCCCFVFM